MIDLIYVFSTNSLRSEVVSFPPKYVSGVINDSIPLSFNILMPCSKNRWYRFRLPPFATTNLLSYIYLNSSVLPITTYGGLPITMSKPSLSSRLNTSLNQVCQRKNLLFSDGSMFLSSRRIEGLYPCASNCLLMVSAISALSLIFLSWSEQE